MRRERSVFRIVVLAIIFNALTSLNGQYVIKGSLLGHDNRPMLRADVFQLSNMTKYPRDILKNFHTGPDGAFEMGFHRPGLYRLLFAGVNHRAFELPVYIDNPDTIILNVRLGGIRYKEDIQEIRIMADYNVENYRFGIKKDVKLNDDGLFQATFDTYDTHFTYQIDRIDEDGDSVNGLLADFYTPDREGDYFSVLKTRKDSTITITFDPALLRRSKSEPEYELIRASERTRKFFIIHEDYSKRYADYHNYVLEGRSRGIRDSDYANNYGWKKDFKELDELIENEQDPFLRKGWIILRIQIALYDAWAKPRAKVSKKLAEMALREIPPDSPLWSYHPNTLINALGYAREIEKQFTDLKQEHTFFQEYGRPFMKYIGEVVSSHPDSSIRAITLESAVFLADQLAEYDLFEKYYNQYLKEFEGTRDKDRIVYSFSPSRMIKPGAPVPDFSFVSLDDPSQQITKQSLLGKDYIMYFWALWCGPCRATSEALSRIWDDYSRDDFTILSISMNYKKEDVVEYRKNKLPMPWLNTHLEKWKAKEGVLKDFEVWFIPRVILIDKNGYIVTVDNVGKDKFWDNVTKHLSRYETK
ncbi:MAG: TlpA disulfide reductase family protein [bacterium]